MNELKRQEMIEDLKTLKEFFIEQSGGASPVCLDYAIRSLEAWDKVWYDILNHEDVWGTGEILEVLDKHLKEVEEVPTVKQWGNHEVACLLAEIFGDTCACNYNGIDEWLPYYCELQKECPRPVGVACWEQFLKHKHKAKEVKQ